MKHPLNLLLLVVLSVVACSHQPDPATVSVDMAHEAEALMALEERWSEMYDAKDLDGIVTLMAQETVLLLPGQPAVVGIASVRQATEQLMADEANSGASVSWKPTSVVIAPSGDMAFDYGTSTTVLADGSEVTGSYLVVWVRENGEWKIAADIFN